MPKFLNGNLKFVVTIATILISSGVVWGTLRTRVNRNSKDIEKTVSKDVFVIHQAEQAKALDRIYNELRAIREGK